MNPVTSASDLYGLPLDQFTPARNDLAKQLKAEGEKEEAARVAKLRKPSTAAWAVNQLVRTQKRTINELFKAGDEMIEAQSKLVGGKGSPDALRKATQKQRAATEKLLEAAGGLLSSEGHGLAANVQERVSETLRAAAVDPDSREQVSTGCLTKELQFTGLGGFGADSPMTSQASEDKQAEEARRHEEELSAAEEQENAARDELKRAQSTLREYEKALREREKALTEATKQRDRAATEADRAKQSLDKARDRRKQLQRGGR